jgi:hypothetical protein
MVDFWLSSGALKRDFEVKGCKTVSHFAISLFNSLKYV